MSTNFSSVKFVTEPLTPRKYFTHSGLIFSQASYNNEETFFIFYFSTLRRWIMELGNWKINMGALHHLPPNDHIISPITKKDGA